MTKVEDVFGVTSRQVLSYVEREQVDSAFQEALNSGKQIIVYGSSKQGKTALVSKHLPYERNILVSLTPKTQLIDIYQQILRSAGVKIVMSTTDKSGTETTASIGAKFKAILPFFGEGTTEGSASHKGIAGAEVKTEEIPVNLELPQSISDLLKRVAFTGWVILENFHYLTDEIQQGFAFDLRAFQELGVHFVILGVWREKNRMAQFNGDLLDRTIEVPVEPWSEEDFRRVADIGAPYLNVTFDPKLIDAAIDASFSSIGVFQELLKHICMTSGVRQRTSETVMLADQALLQKAIESKTDDYAARHQRALEAIAAGHNSGGQKGDRPPLFLPYYLVKVILDHGFEGIANGARKQAIWDWIRAVHHRGDDVRSSDMTNLLGGIANLQSVKSISPPIFAYDQQQRTLQVVDSTFYFFIRNADPVEILESIQNPMSE